LEKAALFDSVIHSALAGHGTEVSPCEKTLHLLICIVTSSGNSPARHRHGNVRSWDEADGYRGKMGAPGISFNIECFKWRKMA
jgi:hypothetical protein